MNENRSRNELWTRTKYVYDGANIIAEYDSSGALAAKYAQGTGIDEPLAMLRDGTVTYYNADGLGSITSLTDASGSAVVVYQTDAFGKSVQTGGTLLNPFRYTAREWDQETSLYYYRARYYDPNTGPFISEDPLRFGPGINFYRFTRNNPVRFTDPLGLFVVGEYNTKTGQVTVTDLHSGQTLTIAAESGGKPFGEPIPTGCYNILQRAGLPEFRLDKQDSRPNDDVDEVTGRNHFRLHKPGRTIGCIAAKDQQQWNHMYDLISNTKNKGSVTDLSTPWWKGLTVESVTLYGTLCVY